MILTSAGALTLGFGAGLVALRRWLYPDAKVNGRRSFIVGVIAPVVVFIIGAMLGTGYRMALWLGALFLASLSLAVLMFFAWLTPTPERMLDRPAIEVDMMRRLKATLDPLGIMNPGKVI